MSLKTIKKIGILVIFALCFLFHFLYDWLPNTLFSIFFPVNESIWEHMKLILSSFYLYCIFEYFVIVKNKICVSNYLFNVFIIPIIGIVVYLIIYLPLYYLFGESMILSIGLLFLVIVLEQVLSYFLLNYKEIKYGNIIGFLGIIITIIIFGYLTYNPIINDLFLDKIENVYGLNYFVK